MKNSNPSLFSLSLLLPSLLEDFLFPLLSTLYQNATSSSLSLCVVGIHANTSSHTTLSLSLSYGKVCQYTSATGRAARGRGKKLQEHFSI